MKIEEAIAHAREVAEGCQAEDRQCAYQHDKLADWLEELKAYQETGLTPEEVITLKSIKSWADAVEHEYLKFVELEKDRRLITLPCKITDTVYVAETVFKKKKAIGERVVSALIDHVTIGGETGKPVFDLCTESGNWYIAMEPEDFYMTREAAEKAAKEG